MSCVVAHKVRWSLWNGRVSELSTGRAAGVSAGLATVNVYRRRRRVADRRRSPYDAISKNFTE
jgi:hypothetical protein